MPSPHSDGPSGSQSLEELRSQVDCVDQNLLKILDERASLVLQIDELKQRKNLPVEAPEREKQILKKICLQKTNHLMSDEKILIFEKIIGEFRQFLQKRRPTYTRNTSENLQRVLPSWDSLPPSKSLMNRLLIILSHHSFSQSPLHLSSLPLPWDLFCEDIRDMKKAIDQILARSLNSDLSLDSSMTLKPSNLETPVYAGGGGTVLRFLALRLSRIPGVHILRGSQRLMSRPHHQLLEILQKLGCQVRQEPTPQCSSQIPGSSPVQWILESPEKGEWLIPNSGLKIPRDVSSQFASAVFLNAWNLQKDLEIHLEGDPVSEGYFEMTIQILQKTGMNLEKTSNGYIIRKNSSLKVSPDPDLDRSHWMQTLLEPDLSSAFAIGALSVLKNGITLENFPFKSSQPDLIFVHFLEKMGIPIEKNRETKTLRIYPQKEFYGGSFDLKSCPDLFPVLALLCAWAQTPSHLYGAPHLAYKESHRIHKVSELLHLIGVKNEPLKDGIRIWPPSNPSSIFTTLTPTGDQLSEERVFDPDQDHRLAFAAALPISQGLPIRLLHPEVVKKSFPNFWNQVKIMVSSQLPPHHLSLY